MNVLSIDLALRGYRDFGMAFLGKGRASPSFPKPEEVGLTGKPEPSSCAEVLEAYCRQADVSVLLLDGPQGWRLPGSQIEHMRLCERVLSTPGKTGTLGSAKPATYLAYIEFSIELFHSLRVDHGWQLLVESWHRKKGVRWVVESFPSYAWLTLGLPRLPGKQRAQKAGLGRWRNNLSRAMGWTLPNELSHDELQAAIVLPAGQAIAQRRPGEIVLSGIDPIISEEGHVLEGLIPNPRLS